MDILHNQLAAVQRQLAFVATDAIDWKFYVQIFSWSVCLFESYLVCVSIIAVVVLKKMMLNFDAGPQSSFTDSASILCTQSPHHQMFSAHTSTQKRSKNHNVTARTKQNLL